MIYALIAVAFIVVGAFLSCVFGANEDSKEDEDEAQMEYIEKWRKSRR